MCVFQHNEGQAFFPFLALTVWFFVVVFEKLNSVFQLFLLFVFGLILIQVSRHMWHLEHLVSGDVKNFID